MKAIIFDMDGTLVDSLMLWDVIWDTISKKYCAGVPFLPKPEDEKAVRTLPLKTGMTLLQDHYNLASSAQELYETINNLFIDFYTNKVTLKPGVEGFLRTCKAQGVKMCVASASSEELIKIALGHCGVIDCFSHIFSCAASGKGKEFPDIFLIARDALGEATEETWVAEDSIVALKTASGIGMPTIGVYDRYNPDQESVRRLSTVYIGPNETMEKML